MHAKIVESNKFLRSKYSYYSRPKLINEAEALVKESGLHEVESEFCNNGSNSSSQCYVRCSMVFVLSYSDMILQEVSSQRRTK